MCFAKQKQENSKKVMAGDHLYAPFVESVKKRKSGY